MVKIRNVRFGQVVVIEGAISSRTKLDNHMEGFRVPPEICFSFFVVVANRAIFGNFCKPERIVYWCYACVLFLFVVAFDGNIVLLVVWYFINAREPVLKSTPRLLAFRLLSSSVRPCWPARSRAPREWRHLYTAFTLKSLWHETIVKHPMWGGCRWIVECWI